ncbi:hypothetical protein TKK_0008031 [Trichogramma kaykai]
MSYLSNILYMYFVLSLVYGFGQSQGVLDKLKTGFLNAKSYLETARDIADLVSKSLNSKKTLNQRGDTADFDEKPKAESFEPADVISTIFKLLGLDPRKITAVAVNSIIYFVQLIGELFKLTPKIKENVNKISDDSIDPIHLIVEKKNEKRLLQQAEDDKLPNQLVDSLDGYNTKCVQLLICKISPIIWAAQKSLRSNPKNSKLDIISWLPSREEFETHFDNCDSKYKVCQQDYILL